jgi:hypothetical protein
MARRGRALLARAVTCGETACQRERQRQRMRGEVRARNGVLPAGAEATEGRAQGATRTAEHGALKVRGRASASSLAALPGPPASCTGARTPALALRHAGTLRARARHARRLRGSRRVPRVVSACGASLVTSPEYARTALDRHAKCEGAVQTLSWQPLRFRPFPSCSPMAAGSCSRCPGSRRGGDTVSARWGESPSPTLYTVTGVVWDLNELRVLVHLAPAARA